MISKISKVIFVWKHQHVDLTYIKYMNIYLPFLHDIEEHQYLLTRFLFLIIFLYLLIRHASLTFPWKQDIYKFIQYRFRKQLNFIISCRKIASKIIFLSMIDLHLSIVNVKRNQYWNDKMLSLLTNITHSFGKRSIGICTCEGWLWNSMNLNVVCRHFRQPIPYINYGADTHLLVLSKSNQNTCYSN
jgi:hypothetical protein